MNKEAPTIKNTSDDENRGIGYLLWLVRHVAEKLNRGMFLVLLVAAPCIAIATQLNLATTPLFLTTSAKPNVFFLADDSRSMDWGMVTTENNGILNLSGCTGAPSVPLPYYYTHPTPSLAAGIAPPASNVDSWLPASEEELASRGYESSPYNGVWRAWNKDYNKLYYNPDVRYTPWEGANSLGANYSNAITTAAYYNPYRPSDGSLDLTSTTSYTTDHCPSGGSYKSSFTVSDFYPARYYSWTDDSGGSANNVVDASDSHTLYEIRASGCTNRAGITATCPASFTRTSARTDCTVSGSSATCTVAQELQNFANWFSYYRKRDLISKNAISKFVGTAANSQYRAAVATLNSSEAASNISMLALNASTTSGNTRSLLNAVYSAKPIGTTTALRTKLDQVGKYYECVSGNIFGLTAGSANCPIQSAADGGACQQNFTVMVTDGVWSDSFTGIGNADESGTYAGGAYADSYLNTLADVAMHYYERDLSATLSNQVPVIAGVDENTTQHMVTYAVALGLSGTLTAMPTNAGDAFTWYDGFDPTAVGASDALKVNDLRHAAYNGRGLYLSATSGDALASALSTAQNSVSDRTGSSAAVAVNSRSLSTSTRLYQARFNSGEWSGDLRALSISSTGSVETQVWSAKDQLKNQNWSSGRVILTANTSSHGIPFLWTTSGGNALTAAQMSYLNTNPTDGTNDSRGEARLKWLRGDTSSEGTGTTDFRVRTGGFKLGDVVDSTPIFVGSPPGLPDLETSPHPTFRSTYVNRGGVIYVGANDGMLHGFDATTGDEKLAYVPSQVFSNLHYLTAPTYSTAHKYYVNGSPTVGDAYATFANGCASVACWRTVLASGLAGGGKGIFALDVTDPNGVTESSLAFNENNASNIVLWEFIDSATPNDMGHVFGQPTITKVRNGGSSYKWAVIFGNGYNSTNEKAVLYVLDIKDGSIIKKVDLSDGTLNTSNGLSEPAVVDIDGDYIADYVYAGDLKGNMWVVDLTSTNTGNWDSKYSSGSTPVPLFVAVDASNRSQVITQRPEVGNHPTQSSGYMVYFGTGRYHDAGDNTASTTSVPINTFYGVWDDDYSGSGTPVTRAKLLAQTISTATIGSTSVRTVSNTTIQNWATSGSCNSDGSGNCLGCRLDLRTGYTDSLGERSVSNPVLLGGTLPRILFTTLIPQSDACSYGGTSWLMEISPTNCGRLSQSVFDIDQDGTVSGDTGDMVGGSIPVSGFNPGIGIMPQPVILRDPANGQDLKAETGSSGAVTTIKNYVSGQTGGRQSWRQLK